MVVCRERPVNRAVIVRTQMKVMELSVTASSDPVTVMETLQELMELPGPTGQEEPVLAWCRDQWARLGAEIAVTPVGNVLAHLGGTGPRLLIQGHADEIGFVVKSIDDRGFLWLDNGQSGAGRSFHFRYPVGQPALVIGHNARVPGIFATVTGHILVTRPEEKTRLDVNDVFVDIGVDSREEAEALGVHVGAGVLWNPPARRLGRRIAGKAIDDRVAIAVMTELLRTLDRTQLTYTLTLAATVQEEIGLIGALSLGHGCTFDLAIALDNGPIGDYPGVDPREMPIRLGHGPALVYKDWWVHYDRRIIRQLRDVAARAGIPVQETTFQGFGSDGAALIRNGVPAALLAVPTRYTHSAFELADERDICGMLDLLRAFVTAPCEPMPLGPS